MTIKEVQTVCFVGAGTMGSFNALVAAVAGYNAVIYDAVPASLANVSALQKEMAAFMVGSGYCSVETVTAAGSRITCVDDLGSAVQSADLVSESVFEDLSLKREVHRQLDELCPPHTILTTNTSSLLVSQIETAVQRGDRFAALHSHLGSPLVDIVGGPRTTEETVDTLKRYVLSLDAVPLVLKKENPGYVLNAMIGTVLTTAMMLVIEGVAEVEEVDRAWMLSQRAPLGPFALMDLFGLNVIYDTWQYKEPDATKDALRPRVLAFLGPHVEQGNLGRKTSKGFYEYPHPAFEDPAFLAQNTDVSAATYALTAALLKTGVSLAMNGVAEPAEVDRAWTVGMTLQTGPFAALDKMGVHAFLGLLVSPAGGMRPEDLGPVEDFLHQRQGTVHVIQ